MTANKKWSIQSKIHVSFTIALSMNAFNLTAHTITINACLFLAPCLHNRSNATQLFYIVFVFFVLFALPIQHLDIVSPFQLYFNPTLIVLNYQVWRLITTFLFFGTIGFNFLFNMTFTYRYCRMLEEGSFRGKSSDFIMMFIFGGALMTVSRNDKSPSFPDQS